MLRYFIIPLVLALVGALLLMQLFKSLDALLAWLLSITLITFLTYGYDKATARSNRLRMPESALLALAFVGGTAGALGSMAVFRHKTRKHSFQLKFLIVLVIQVTLIIGYYWLRARL